MRLIIEPHPLLAPSAFRTRFDRPLGECPTSERILGLLAAEAAAPLERSEEVRRAVRDMLRHGGYKPTGRGKPASEYLVRAAAEGRLAGINLAVDACNATSLHSGLPISVVDLDRVQPPLHIGLAAPGASFVFNRSGQMIDLSGLPCLHDAQGPCANAVKDAQRSKTDEATRVTLSIVWAPRAHADLLARTTQWYRELLEEAGAVTDDVCLG